MSNESFVAPTLEELAPLFPNYSIDAFIAQGGMGAVYLATQTSLERQVAIKILPREFGQDVEFRNSFAAEAKAMAKLNHPNLIGVYDFGEVDGMPFIVMEYVAGKPLHDSAYGKQIDPTEAARIVKETLRGLHHAHEHDILHRDVKPANILMDPHHAEAKLGDFGLAMAASEEGDDGLIFGTPGYAAPEVYEGKPDARSDVYAAAVILYQLLTGQLPEVPYQHPSALAKCDRRFDALLAKALQPEAHSRFQTAAEFADELDAIQKRPAGTVAAPSHALASRRAAPLASAKKNNGGAIIGVVLAIVALIAAFVFLSEDKEEEKPEQVAEDNTITIPAKKEEKPSLVLEEKTEPIPNLKKEEHEQEFTSLDEPEEIDEPMEEDLAANPEQDKEPNKPEIVKEEKPLSTFDHLAFLARGRDYCVKNATKVLSDYKEDLIKNIDKLEREGKSILRDESYITRDSERARKDNLELTLNKYRETGNLPLNLLEATPESLRRLTFRDGVVERAIREALDAQHEIEQELESELKPLTASYATGVRKQADALKAEDNDYDANILEQEAAEAEGNFSYFLKIINGSNPNPPGLSVDPSTMDLSELMQGVWKINSGDTTFILSANGIATSASPTQNGTWKIEGESALVAWSRHVDTLRFSGSDYNTLKCESSRGTTHTLIRVNKLNFKKEAEEETISDSDPIIGDWLRDDEQKTSLYSFHADGTILQDHGQARGKWTKLDRKEYRVNWGNGAVLKVKSKGKKTLIINNGQFKLTRQD